MILVILTSHRADCFAICVKCLEQYTNLALFEKIYVMANDLGSEHIQLAASFAARHSNAIIVSFGPRGMEPVMAAQETVLRQHPDSIVVKLDEDVFVTEGWLEGLLKSYATHKGSGCGLVSALVPNNQVGRKLLDSTFCKEFPAYAKSAELREKRVPINPEYALWVWKNIIAGRMDFSLKGLRKNLSEEKIEDYLSINCILMSPDFVSLMLPFGSSTDEYKANLVLSHPEAGLYGVVTPKSLAHHYSFGPQQQFLDERISVPDLEKYL